MAFGREREGYTRGPIFPVGHCAAALLKDGLGLGSGLEWGGLLVRGASEESWSNHLRRMKNHFRAIGVSVESGWSTIGGHEGTVICTGAPEQSGRHTPWQLIWTVHCGLGKGKITTWINK